MSGRATTYEAVIKETGGLLAAKGDRQVDSSVATVIKVDFKTGARVVIPGVSTRPSVSNTAEYTKDGHTPSGALMDGRTTYEQRPEGPAPDGPTRGEGSARPQGPGNN